MDKYLERLMATFCPMVDPANYAVALDFSVILWPEIDGREVDCVVDWDSDHWVACIGKLSLLHGNTGVVTSPDFAHPHEAIEWLGNALRTYKHPSC